MHKSIHLKKSPGRILVISMRYLGDLMATTPLIHCLRAAYPDADIDVLAYSHTAPLLEGNPDIDRVIPTPMKPAPRDYWPLWKSLFRKYDLALVPQSGNRRNFYAILAAPVRVLMVNKKPGKGWWKRIFGQGWTEYDADNHTVHELLNFTKVLGIPALQTLIPPRPTVSKLALPPEWEGRSYAVLHIHPQWRYKQWTLEGWIEIARHLQGLGLDLLFTGGPGTEEHDYIEAVRMHLPEPGKILNLAGRPSLAALAELISRAKLFIGVDTGITHLAAATGTPVIALYGPTLPEKWGPWPANYTDAANPYRRVGSQQVSNIYLIQGEGDCVPCGHEGCDRHRQSRSECLDTLPAEKVKPSIQKALAQSGYL
ncbi:MAG: glycosyltransferase family 9 protein [Nitrospinaceae bacterium]|jgi:heptosyltransferase-3|nr:MAG: glycosyltransferase family 9 protein [Nitrospinaceae bacterium]